MTKPQTYKGTPTQLAEQLLTLPGSQKYRMTLIPEEPVEEGAESLEAAIARMTSRTPEEIAASPPPRELPAGKTIFDVIMGKWPGNETDEQIFAALEKLS